MNYFAHGRRFLDRPFFLAGTALPDWMNVVDRRNRVRRKQAALFVDHAEERTADFAAGVVQHHFDDAWFHETLAFTELSLNFSRDIRNALPDDEGFRPHFLGHILVEILLDAVLIEDDPDILEAYYAALDDTDTNAIERSFEQIAGRPAPQLARFIGLFSKERFLWDYLDDAKLLFRLNQVMRRVTLPTLPLSFRELFPQMRAAVSNRQSELLNPEPRTLSPAP